MDCRSVIAFLGFLASLVLYLSSAFIFRDIYREGSVQGYSFLPYPMALLNCMIWTFYGTVHPDSTFVIIINCLGMVIEGIYVGIYIWFSDGVVRQNARSVLLVLLVPVVLVSGLGFGWTHKVFGYAGVASGIIMYGSPLSITKRVVETGSVENLSLSMASACLVNSSLWTAYAFMSKPYDLYIAIPNVLGWVLAVAQLSLYAYYYYNREHAVVA
ncbi:bidirectional sugar transporter SWEET4-like [Miscanthus floridulus]|uniref:bidirectional sugar transporter SWEET4-like n=1 Tax=Miscanthus floridulus TaxID=154761 RepID=UPI0034595C13